VNKKKTRERMRRKLKRSNNKGRDGSENMKIMRTNSCNRRLTSRFVTLYGRARVTSIISKYLQMPILIVRNFRKKVKGINMEGWESD
jgi:hypothetical protein